MSAKRLRSWILIGGSAGIAACAALYSRVQRTPEDSIKFSHARHAKAKVECATCHEDIFDAKTVTEINLPAEKKCLECHREQKASGNCTMCHTDVKVAGPYQRSAEPTKISHAFHLEKFGEDCTRCHKTLSESHDDRPVPPMSTCLDCHEHDRQYANAECSVCHVDLTRYPLRPISAYSHEGNFLRTHGFPAHSSPQACAQCHDQNFCTDCHTSTVAAPIELKAMERVDRQFIHRGDYLSRHSLEASALSPTCERCHATKFCQNCHIRQNLTPNASSPNNPHPAGFNLPGSRNFHGPAARRDIGSCAGCHDQGPNSNCVSCHRVGGIGGNPHPAGYRSRHNQQEINGNAMCLACHR